MIQIRCGVIRNILMILLFALNTNFPRNGYFDDVMMRCMKCPHLPVHFNLFVFLPPPSFTVSNLFIHNAPSSSSVHPAASLRLSSSAPPLFVVVFPPAPLSSSVFVSVLDSLTQVIKLVSEIQSGCLD